MSDKFKKISELVVQAKAVLLVTHPKPDGDALGSICAMIGYLKLLNKQVRAFCRDAVPGHFRFLPWQEEIQADFSVWEGFQPELIIILDLPDWERSGIKNFVNQIQGRYPKIVVLDHHAGELPRADIAFIDTSYAATAEIIFDYFETSGFTPSAEIASALLTGLLTDTENFTNQGATPRTFAAASRLMRLGANFDKLTQATWRFRGFDELRLMGLALNRLSYNKDLGMAVTVVKAADLQSLKLGDDPFAGFPNFLKGLTDGKAVLLLVEQPGKIKGSLRSIDQTVDVRQLAQVLGGGGHRLSAGFVLPGRLEQDKGHWQVV